MPGPVCPYPGCRYWRVEHVEDYPTVTEWLCLLCHRFFSVARAEAHPEGREGLMTVYDSHGVYAGCIGSEIWARLLESEEPDRAAA